MVYDSALDAAFRGSCVVPFLQEELYANITDGCKFLSATSARRALLIKRSQISLAEYAPSSRQISHVACHVLRQTGYTPIPS